MPLSNSRILVTGGARGLGRAIAQAAIEAGARVTIADILEQEGQETVQALGSDATFVALNLADPESIERGVAKAATSMGGIDGLVNNGAIATGIGGKSMDEIELDVWDEVMQVNVRGTWLTTRAVKPYLIESKCGRVVNLASDTALWGAPKLMHYVASKGAVISMTRSMARELGKHDVAVNAVAPGLVIVEATDYVPEERHDLYVKGRAIQRKQYPEDLTGAVMFLLSPSAGFITGQVLPVNGGFTM